MANKAGISQEIVESGDRMLQMVKEGNICQHILSNSSLPRYGEKEHQDTVQYADFIKTKFCFDLLELNGKEYV